MTEAETKHDYTNWNKLHNAIGNITSELLLELCNETLPVAQLRVLTFVSPYDEYWPHDNKINLSNKKVARLIKERKLKYWKTDEKTGIKLYIPA